MSALLLACSSPSTPVDTAPDSGEVAPPATFESAAVCGECHSRQYGEWQQSMHAYAALSPVFDAMAGKAFRAASGGIGTFCTGCHAPFGQVEGEGGASTAATRSALSREGISCEACHTAIANDGVVGNARLVRDPGGPMRGPYASDAMEHHSSVHDEFATSSELCGSCHDVFVYPEPRIEQAYTEHEESPAAEAGTRCQDCHMSPVPGAIAAREWGPSAEVAGQTYPDRELTSHRFIGPDYALIDDFPYPDDLEASAAAQAEHLQQIQVLLENAARISSLQASWGQSMLTVTVELESLINSHRVPTGFTSERQLWVEITVKDERGTVMLTSGDLDADGNLRDAHSPLVQQGLAEEDAWLINLQSVNRAIGGTFDEQGNTTSWQDSEVVFPFDADSIERRSLKPLEKRAVTYSPSVPNQDYTVQVALKYRSLPPYVLQALQLDALLPRLQVFTIDSAELSVVAE